MGSCAGLGFANRKEILSIINRKTPSVSNHYGEILVEYTRLYLICSDVKVFSQFCPFYSHYNPYDSGGTECPNLTRIYKQTQSLPPFFYISLLIFPLLRISLAIIDTNKFKNNAISRAYPRLLDPSPFFLCSVLRFIGKIQENLVKHPEGHARNNYISQVRWEWEA